MTTKTFWRSPWGVNLRAAALLGLISSSLSTLVSQLLAARIGRDAVVDWMTVAVIPGRDAMLQIEPGWRSIVTGIAFHQWADFSWEVFFFGVLGHWTSRLRPWTILLFVVLPWTFFSSAMEWAGFVPLFPFFQPIFGLEQPYWIGLLVHASSASMYPFFPFLRDWVAGRSPSPNRSFATTYAGLAAIFVAAFSTLAICGAQDRELPWMGGDKLSDQSFMRRMSAHHVQGITVARMAIDKASDPHLRAIARLIAAEQVGEIKIFDQWWRSWFSDMSKLCSSSEMAAMPGMLSSEQIAGLQQAQGPAFDSLFIQLMTVHHLGAIRMADDEMHSLGDLRLRIMAQGTRHGQQGEIEMMRGTHGLAAIRAAWLDMFSARLLDDGS